MKKVYLASGISDKARKRYQKEVAEKIEALGYEVYAASRNDSINDKSNNPTPLDIYNGDIDRIKECDIFVVCISGGNEDGTLSEIGMVAGWNEYYNFSTSKIAREIYGDETIKIIAYTTNERLMQPQFWNGIPSGGFNHLVAGMISRWGVFVGTEEDMLARMKELV